MRQWIMALLGLCASINVSAAVYNRNTTNFEINIPRFYGSFEGSLTAIDVTTRYHNTDLALIDNNPTNAIYPKGHTTGYSFDNDYGYALMLGWRIRDTGNDVQLHYYCVKTSADANVSAGGEGDGFWLGIGNVSDMTETNAFIRRANSATGTLDINLTRYRLQAGQHINIGCRGHLHFFAGASIDCVEKCTAARFLGLNTTDFLNLHLNSSFSGRGPYFGMDIGYTLNYGFGLAAQGSCALLSGDIDSKVTLNGAQANEGINTGAISIQHRDRTMLVPNLEGRIGINYSYVYRCYNAFTLEFGYWANHYLHAINEIQLLSGSRQANYENKLYDVAFNGFYFTLHAAF